MYSNLVFFDTLNHTGCRACHHCGNNDCRFNVLSWGMASSFFIACLCARVH